MRTILILILLILILLMQSAYAFAFGFDWEDSKIFDVNKATTTLRVISSTDTSVFAPIIERYLETNPNVNVEYLVAGSTDIYDLYQQTPDSFDVVISSAMDLQLKLVNDGYARKVNDIDYPDWAHWRQSLFGFTLEPAAIVVNKAAFENVPLPKSRQELIQVLRANPEKFRNKIGTYDVRRSGLGYLFATQDARRSETFWRLMEIMGSLDARVYCCSGEMLEDLASGEIVMSYNVLGSYAMDRKEFQDKVDVILPLDFPTTMMRTAFVSKQAQHSEAAVSFLRYLASSQWSSSDQVNASLPSLQSASANLQLSVISLEPALMIFLDKMKRSLFIKEWESAIIQ